MTQLETVNDGQLFDIERIKKYLQTMNLASNLTTGEVEQFIEISKSFNLNPFKREIYANKYGDKFSVIVGYETYIKRAERSGLLSGWHVSTEGVVDTSNVFNSSLRAIITIHRKDFEFPFVHEVHFSEYVGRKKDGSITEFWKNKPITMIKKVSIAQGFRLCFSDELGGMPYTTEELVTIEEDAVVVSSSKPDKKKKENVQVLKQETVSKDTVRIRKLLESIKSTKTMDDLIKIWKENEDLQGEVVFKNAMTFRKNQLNDQLESQNSLLEQVRSAQTPEELFDLTVETTDQEILKAADERLKTLYQEQSIENQGNEIEE